MLSCVTLINLYRVLEFNKFDLYTKTFDVATLDVDELWKYYDSLLAKFNMDGPLDW